MALKIKVHSLFKQWYLEIDSDGVKFCETAAWGGVRRFRFQQVEYILMSPDGVLSFQVGNEVFSIPTKPDNPKHQEVVNTFVREVTWAREGGPAIKT